MATRWKARVFLGALPLLLAACGALAPGGSPQVLLGRWELIALGDDVPLRGLQITAEFTPQGRLRGGSGCNRYEAGFRARSDGSWLAIDELQVTAMACLEPWRMELEREYLQALAQAAGFERQGDRLILLEENGTPLLTFRLLD